MMTQVTRNFWWPHYQAILAYFFILSGFGVAHGKLDPGGAHVDEDSALDGNSGRSRVCSRAARGERF
jgi:hypothetical protein